MRLPATASSATTRIDPGVGAELAAQLRGDCHTHTTWSDGGASAERMARAAMALGHEYLVITDHSPRLTIAHGLSPERLREQLDEIAALERAAGAVPASSRAWRSTSWSTARWTWTTPCSRELDVVVASVHSKLSMPRDEMTRRMVHGGRQPARRHPRALHRPQGRRAGTRRSPTFDAELVFAACAQFGTAVEINCRPERQDPPEELLTLALEWGCDISIDTDAHAPGQLEWLPYGARQGRALRRARPSGSSTPAARTTCSAWTAAHAA